MSREYRSLARALQPQPSHNRRSLLFRLIAFTIRHLPEIIVVWLLVRAWQIVAGRIGPVWTDVAVGALVLGLMSWRRSRRFVVGVFASMLTRARLRAAFKELRLTRRSGRPPFTLAVALTAVGERVWLCCPVGVSAEDIADETDRLRSACFAREVRVTRSQRFSAFVTVDVIRRDPLGATAKVPSSFGRRGHVRQQHEGW
jgi:hypothetical protein